MVFDEGDTVIAEPVPAGVPPQLPVYHCHCAPDPKDPPETESWVEAPSQIGFTVALIAVGAVDVVSGVNKTL